MSSDEEALNRGSALCGYLLDNVYTRLTKRTKTYSVVSQHQNTFDNIKSLDLKSESFTQISSYDKDKLITILNSKLLLFEDVKFLEVILSNTSAFETKPNFLVLSGINILGLVTSITVVNRGLNVYLPLSITSLCTVYSIWKCYSHLNDMKLNKLIICHITVLRSLCLNIHKLLQFLKETEILSTGQVSSHNISSAMYVAPKNIILENIPSWKTLPHVRKCLADALISIIDILSSANDVMKHFLPSWMRIKGFSFSNNNLGQDAYGYMSTENCTNSDHSISLKTLYSLNETYLVLQSDYLKWTALCFCNFVTNKSSKPPTLIYSKQMYKLLSNIDAKLTEISVKLKIHYNIQEAFKNTNKSDSECLESIFDETNHMQIHIHSVFLSVLSIVIKLKSLEDEIEKVALIDNNAGNIGLKEHISKQLRAIKEDLGLVCKSHEEMYQNLYYENRSYDKRSSENIGMNIFKSELRPICTSLDVEVPDCSITAHDEVFLALSGMKTEIDQSCTDDWFTRENPQIPSSLLAELSISLERIKKDFKEREKLALKRVGLQDIDYKSDDECEEKCVKYAIPSLSRHSVDEYKFKKVNQPNIAMPCTGNGPPVIDSSVLHDNMKHQSILPLNNFITVGENDVRNNIDASINNSLLANMIANKSQLWKKTKEDFYSNS